jgi:hypothetical protein
MPSQHKYPAFSFRPPEGDRLWLLRHAASTGRAVNAILRQALAEYRKQHDPDPKENER